MTEKEKMLGGLPYKAADATLTSERLLARELVYKISKLPPSQVAASRQLYIQLLGSTPEVFHIEAPFRCDYGYNISIGNHFYANFNLTILDCAPVSIGDHVFIAPNVGIFTAGHPIHYGLRNQEFEFALPITIGNNVWIGGNVVINPGVSIGDNTVIGSGAVVTKNIPANVIAAGNPCRVIRAITQADKDYYYKGFVQ